MDYNIFGVSFNKEQLLNWRDEFDIVEYGDSLALVSKKQYNHGEDEGFMNNLKYRYVILGENVEYGATITNEDGEEIEADHYALYLVPEIECVSDKVIKRVAEFYGMEDEPIETLREKIGVTDLAAEGESVYLGEVNSKPLTWEDNEIWDSNVLNQLATVTSLIDWMRGFYLDRPWNGFGMTGWDSLEMAVNGLNFGDMVARLNGLAR